MTDFSDSFFRGLRFRRFHSQDRIPPLRPDAFIPPGFNKGVPESEHLETSIVWNENSSVLDFYINTERLRPNSGNIVGGVVEISYSKALTDLENNHFLEHVSFNDDPDLENKNPYHGNIRFDKEYFYGEMPDGSLGPLKTLMKQTCECFCRAEINFYPPENDLI